ncbi:Annexin_9 [Hexamita inflata]|uniref:Annexin 9 n=1 Tax=Hexamita inflata TaxID=28002 RepID=A0AA86PZ41_9EUKA|nr:Annexin 9 [Hexamita inflata]
MGCAPETPYVRTTIEQAVTDLNADLSSKKPSLEYFRVMTHFDLSERQQINREYSAKYGDLAADLAHFPLLLNYLAVNYFEDRITLWAKSLHNAMDGLGTNEHELIWLILLQSTDTKQLVEEKYTELFNENLSQRVHQETNTQNWAKLIRCKLRNKNEMEVDVNEMADRIDKAANAMLADSACFINLLCKVEPHCYREVIQRYQEEYENFEGVLKKEFFGNTEYAFLLMNDWLINPVTAVARLINRFIEGIGTMDQQLCLCTLLFSDRYKKGLIRTAYKKYGSMVEDVKFDTLLCGKAILIMWGLEE